MFDHLHPALVHVPVGLALVLPVVVVGLAVARWREWVRPRSWSVVVLLQAIVVVGALLALQTGESLEEHGERMAGEAAVEAHEEAGDILAGASALGLLLFASVFLARSPRPLAALLTSSVAASLLLAALTAWTGHLGGQITHGTHVAAAGDNPVLGERGDWDDD